MLAFEYSWIVWLAPLPLIVRWLVPPHIRAQPAVRVPFLPRLQAADGGASRVAPRRLGRSLATRGAVWLLVLAALARPQWLEPPIERSLPTRDLLLLVDLSGSMEHEDFRNESGQAVDRLTAAKEVLGDFLARRAGDRVGLVVFGSAPFLQVPFTTDLALCQQLLDETAVGMAGPRTALGDAIGLGIRLFENSDVPTRTIIALTDGNDTDSAVPPVEAARVAKDREITIHAVAMGDPTTVGEEELDQDALKAVAKTTGGDFFLAMNRSELAGIYDRLDEIETREVKTVSHRPRRDLYFWPLAAALLVSLAAHAWRLLIGRTAIASATAPLRLRVNTRTFELEAIER
jgi:Ca-activated chloride channel family protein